MARRALSALLLTALACDVAYAKFGRNSFHEDFIFGTGSAAYQYEGAYKEGGKGLSVWDIFSHIPGKIKNNDTGDVADDFYHRYKEDVKLLKDMNLDAFRFSIAWTRILPTGSLSGGINKEGVAFYNNLINEVIANESATEEVVYEVIAEPQEQTEPAPQEFRDDPAQGPVDTNSEQQPAGQDEIDFCPCCAKFIQLGADGWEVAGSDA